MWKVGDSIPADWPKKRAKPHLYHNSSSSQKYFFNTSSDAQSISMGTKGYPFVVGERALAQKTSICLSPCEEKTTSSSDSFPLKPTRENKNHEHSYAHERTGWKKGRDPPTARPGTRNSEPSISFFLPGSPRLPPRLPAPSCG